MKHIFCIFLFLVTCRHLYAQVPYAFTSYSDKDGLSQNTVMGILQDHKGIMWFATWNGINKFDGYTFTSYKSAPGNGIDLTTNRTDQICEDKYGFLWVLVNDRQVYRFNPDTEIFEHISTERHMGNAIVKSIDILPNGTIWLLTKGKGALRISTAPSTFKLACKWYVKDPERNVHNVYQDKRGNEWIMSDNGLNVLSAGTHRPGDGYVETPSRRILPDIPFYSVTETDDDLYFGSANGQIWRYDKAYHKFKRFQLPFHSDIFYAAHAGASRLLFVSRKDGFCLYDTRTRQKVIVSASRLPEGDIKDVFVDHSGEIWINQDIIGTVVHYNSLTNHVKVENAGIIPARFDPTLPPFRILEDKYGQVWVHPKGGGFSLYNRQTGTLQPFHDKAGSRDWRFSNKLHYAYSDRQGNLWLSTFSKGIEKITFRYQPFRLVAPVNYPEGTSDYEIRALEEDSQGHLFVGVRGGRLWAYDPSTYKPYGYMTEAGTIAMSGTALQGSTYAILEDHRHCLWIATKGGGLVRAVPQGNLRYRLTRYIYDPHDPYSLSHNSVYNLFEDSHGRIWVATYGGGINYVEQAKDGRIRFIHGRNRLRNYPLARCSKVRFITEDTGSGDIWAGTNHGAIRFNGNFKSPERIHFYNYERQVNNPHSLSNNDVHMILVTHDHRIYLATFGGGLNRLQAIDAKGNAVFQSYTTKDGLPSDILLTMKEDKSGNIWISTEDGICRFTPQKKSFDNFTNGYLAMNTYFSEGASLYTSDGKMILGTNRGFMIFNPEKIHKSDFIPSIELSKLLLSNQEVTPGHSSVLKKILNSTTELAIPHDKNIFTIQYAALDYANPSEIEYAYRLKGFDENWNYVGKQRTATYTNLPKGTYVFEVRSTNSDGVWCHNSRALTIEILPSFWETGWAYLLYVLFALAIMALTLYISLVIYRLKHRVSMEKAMTDMKLRFFTDISHELRTPLTLIAGPVEYILKEKPLSTDLRRELQVVERNTSRMLRLVNQILDFRKLQANKMKLRLQQFDVVAFVQNILDSFYSAAEEHHIRLTFEAEKEPLYLWADEDKFEKIMLNLLSNAFKYTPDNKTIRVVIREDELHIFVSIIDEGIGIEDKFRHSIFQRFENIADKNLFNRSSTGIGLSLVKELVDMHKGTIDVKSEVGKGSCFTVSFIKGKEHFDENTEFLVDDKAAGDGIPADYKDTVVSADDNSHERMSLLVVEDNVELRSFLRSIFLPSYTILEAANGEEGIQTALTQMPDLIISDIMMPVKDGAEMVKEIRANLSISHIPVILLTAKTSVENRIKGLEYGADDYITKPFSTTYLQARVKNLLLSRRKLQEYFRQNLMGETVHPDNENKNTVSKESVNMSPVDRKFMNQFVELVRQNMNKPEIVIEDFAKELAVSRSVFFKKVKSLTGVAPVEFIRDMKITRARELLKSGQYSISEVSYMVGFNTPRYFSKTFKLKTGVTPTEFLKGIQ